MTETVDNLPADKSTAPPTEAAAPAVEEPKTAPVDAAPAIPPTEAAAPGTWQEKLAGGDARELKRLMRFTTEADAFKAFRELESRVSTGELKMPLPEKPTEAQLSAWRKENGIPDKPDGYKIELSSGRVVGDDDKPVVDAIISKMHNVNATPAQINTMVDTYYEQQEAATTALGEWDATQKQNCDDTLRNVWGPDYRANQNVVANLTGTFGEGIAEHLSSARSMVDGTLLIHNPGFMNELARIGREINPIATIAGSSDASFNPKTELAAIRTMMRENPSAYYKDTQVQERYRQLLGYEGKAKG